MCGVRASLLCRGVVTEAERGAGLRVLSLEDISTALWVEHIRTPKADGGLGRDVLMVSEGL